MTTHWDPQQPLVLPPIGRRTVAAVFDEALRRVPDKVAVRDPDASLSYGALHERALRLGGGFASRGFAAGEHVLLMLDNHLDYVVAWLGLALTGRVEVPVNTAYKGSILAHVVNNSGARAIVLESHYVPVLAEVADRLTGLELVVVRGDASAAAAGLPGRLRVAAFDELFGPAAPPADLKPWDLIGILYTSGTTGLSKGVRVTNAHAYGYATPALFDVDRPDEVTMVTLPLFHIGGQWAGVYKSLIGAASAVVLPRFSATTFWEDVRRYGCTYTMLLGAMANFLWRQPPSPADRGHPLRRVSMIPVIAQLEAFKERFGIEAVGTGYGLTEGSTILRAPMGCAEPGLAGWLRPDFEARLVDENDIEVPEGEVGELVVRTRDPWSVMDGYHAMPEATVKAWRNQWLHTGDAFRRDATGRWYFLDRLKDAVRRRGENVSSFEVESEINEHPAVLESAVIAVPSDASEDEIKACVVLRPGQAVSAPELLDFLDKRLPYFMVPRYVEFLERLPKTPTEKVQKQALRERGITPETYDRPPTGGRKS
jgi:crotonobetaine/carnitine-CoA ligase